MKNCKSGDRQFDRARWFFWGFGAGIALTALVASIAVKLLYPSLPPPPPKEGPQLFLSPAGLIVCEGGTTDITSLLSGEYEALLYLNWSSDVGGGLPNKPTVATTVSWTAPSYARNATITAAASYKEKGSSSMGMATGSVVIPVVGCSSPIKSIP